MDPNLMEAARVFHAVNFAPNTPDARPLPASARLRELFALCEFYSHRNRFPTHLEYMGRYTSLWAFTAFDYDAGCDARGE